MHHNRLRALPALVARDLALRLTMRQVGERLLNVAAGV